MLVLTRKVGEVLEIGNCEVTILQATNKVVTIEARWPEASHVLTIERDGKLQLTQLTTLNFVKSNGKKGARIGIDAPRHIQVYRPDAA